MTAAIVKDEKYWAAVRRAADQIGPIPAEARDKIALLLRGSS